MTIETVELELMVHYETEKAILASDTGIKADAVWLPKSQIHMDGPDPTGVRWVTVPEWLAAEKDLV